MHIDVRLIGTDEFDQVLTLDGRAFGITYTDDDIDDVRSVLELDRMLVAVDGHEVVGSAGAFTFELTVPGGAFVPTAGVTWVGVMPSHRRRGILRQLMTRQLDDIAERGEPLAALTASEAAIYGRFGYGYATRKARLVLSSRAVHLRDGIGDDGLVRFADAVTARKTLPGIYDRARAAQPGTVSRDDRYWDYLLRDLESSRGGATALQFLVHPDGFAIYRRRGGWVNGFPHGEAIVVELVATTFEAHAALWRFLLSLDLVEQVSFGRFSLDDPLMWLVDDPRQVRLEAVWDDEWVRVLHVPTALEARRYLTEDRLVLELVDGFRPVTGGRFELDGSPDGATCRRTTAEPDLVIGIAELGSMYLGGVPATALVQARRIEERTAGAARRANAMFASDPPPHNQTPF